MSNETLTDINLATASFESVCLFSTLAHLGIIENSFIRNVAAWGLVKLLLLLLLLLLAVKCVRGDNQVLGLLAVQVSVALQVVAVAGVH